QRSGDIRHRGLACVMANGEPFTLASKDNLGRDGEAREAKRMNLRASHGRASRLACALRLREWDSKRRRTNTVEPLSKVARRTARRIHLGGPGIVDHFPRMDVTCGLGCQTDKQPGRQGKVAGDHADMLLLCTGVDLRVIRGREAA